MRKRKIVEISSPARPIRTTSRLEQILKPPNAAELWRRIQHFMKLEKEEKRRKQSDGK